ncbi:hypothetical protein [Rhodococcus ruber]|uniref:hypothetical protein n=1 Tax=Rhodococcus ruber TaxID=1830 RepID=UPI00126945FF|nr:hypothetical protein [Rhodococcus ruber]
MSDGDNLTEKILTEMHEMQDWVSVADVLKVMGTNSWVASVETVQSILDCVNSSDRLRIGRVDNGYKEIPKPLPIAALLERIFREEDASNRSAEMMQLFIDQVR